MLLFLKIFSLWLREINCHGYFNLKRAYFKHYKIRPAHGAPLSDGVDPFGCLQFFGKDEDCRIPRVQAGRGAITEVINGANSIYHAGQVSLTKRLSRPTGLEWNARLEAAGEPLTVHSLNTGVPHAVVMVDDPDTVDLARLGPALRFHPHFAPKGTNVNFVGVQGPGRIAIRTYERGVEGETLACGTGVCAAALLYARLAGVEPPIAVRVRGGDTLSVSFRNEGDAFENVTLTGPADFVFDGEIALAEGIR